MDVNKAFEVLNGVLVNENSAGNVIEGPFYTGGPDSPVGLNLPANTIYTQNKTDGVVIWQKFNNGVNDWRVYPAKDISFDPTGTDITATNVQDAVGSVAGRNFGKGANFEQSATGFVTTSGSFVVALDILEVLPEDGTYRIGWSSNFITSKSNTLGEHRVVIDAGTVDELVVELKASTNFGGSFDGFDAGLLTAGNHTISLEFRRSTGNGTVTWDALRLEVWRIL